MTEPPPPGPPLTPKVPLNKRYTLLVWRVLLISNLALGAYMFVRTRKKDTVNGRAAKKSVGDGKTTTVKVPSDPITSPTTLISEIPSLPPPVTEPVKVRQPIPDDQQRELFQWMLEEKRKIKTKDHQQKKQIDEDKAILKQLIRAKSVPSL